MSEHWFSNELVCTDMLDYVLRIEHFDKHLGCILQTLEEEGRLENTIIVATSDYGMLFPRCKGQEYSNLNYVPMVVMWKNDIKKPGQMVDDYISSTDIAPTLSETVGVE